MRFPLLCFALGASAFGQTEAFLGIDRPAAPAGGWGHVLLPLHDIDGDGVPDLLIGQRGFSPSQIATVHSGASGDTLFNLVAPHAEQFHGDSFMTVADETGDGLPEILTVVSGSFSTPSLRGKLMVYSSADGTLLRETAVASDLFLSPQMQFGAISPGDVDGDGTDDVLTWVDSTVTPLSNVPMTLLSGRTGAALAVAQPAPGTLFVRRVIAALSDHDGDGIRDTAILSRNGTALQVEVRSSATGSIIRSFAPPSLAGFSGDHEAFDSIADVDGDGLRDLVFGGLFEGYVGIYSSATGQQIRSWDCSAPGTGCFGSRIVQMTDLNGNGSPDLLAVESKIFASSDIRIFGLDPLSGEVLFDQAIPGLAHWYSDRDRIVALGAVDPLGFPTFAIEQTGERQVEFHRILPELGDKDCWGTTGASGQLADLSVRGSASVGSSYAHLSMTGGVPLALAAFVYGTERDHYAVGPASFCVGSHPGLIRAGFLDPTGSTTQSLDLQALGAMAMESWSFQAIFRDASAGGVRASNAVTVEITP